MDKAQTLVLLQALYNRIGKAVSTKEPGSLRSEVNEHYKKLYEATGATSFDINLDGGKVAKFSLTVSDGEEKTYIRVDDDAALKSWARGMGFIDELVNWDKVYAYFDGTGDIPDGCCIETEVTGPCVSRTALRVNDKAVENAIAALSGSQILALGAGDE